MLITARPFVDKASFKALTACRAKRLFLVGDFDDVLFDVLPGGHRPEHSPRDALSTRLMQRVSVYRESLSAFDAFTTATEPLAERLRELRPGVPVHVVPNGISLNWARRSRLLYPRWRPGDPKVICYLPGSPSHDADFASVSQVLAAFMRDHRDVRLEIMGPLAWDTTGFPSDRVQCRSSVPFEQLGAILASSCVNLAPLCQTQYNRCKSSIKFLEAAVMGCPTIATPIPDLERHRGHGVLLPRTEDEWHHALSMVLDDDQRMMLGSRAEEWVLSRATALESVDALFQARATWEGLR